MADSSVPQTASILPMPQVSVIIPTHNRAEHLPKALNSVLQQSYQDFEIVVVDDASVDHTPQVVARFKDPRIRYLRHDTNKGGSAARNTGIINSSSPFLAFLDDDDEWVVDKLQKQLSAILKSPQEVGVIYTGHMTVDLATGKVLDKQVPVKNGDLSRALLIENCVGSTSTVLLRRECLNRVGLFDESLPCSQDYDLWIRISAKYQFEFIPEALLRYYVHGKRITSNLNQLTRGLELIVKKHPMSRIFCGRQYNDIGVNYCLAGDLKSGRKVLMKGIRSRPLQVRSYGNLVLSFLGASYFRRFKTSESDVMIG